MVHTFADSFWDEDFNGTTGYDALIYRLKDGKKCCDNIAEFLRNRSKIEEDYGKNLIRLAQSSGTNEEVGTLKDSWESVKKEMENIGSVHCEFSRKLTELLERTLKFRERQKADRLKVDDKMKKLQKDKKTAFDNMIKTKRMYEQKCKEHDQSNEIYESKATYTPKEEDRLKKNVQKTKSNAETADTAYRNSVKCLDENRIKWIHEMEDSMKLFQKWEEERVAFLRNEMWTYCNLSSIQLLSEEKLYDRIRNILENCEVAVDIQYFISQKRTGSKKPDTIPYESYYHENITLLNSTNTNNSPRSLANIEASNNIYSTPDTNSHLFTKGAQTNNTHNFTNMAMQYSNTNSSFTYSTVNDEDLQQAMNQYFVKAVFPYTAQGTEELSLKVGDIVEVIKVEDKSWGIGLLNGICGAFPLEYVDRVD